MLLSYMMWFPQTEVDFEISIRGRQQEQPESTLLTDCHTIYSS